MISTSSPKSWFPCEWSKWKCVLNTYSIGLSVTSDLISAMSLRAAAGVTLVSTSIAWSSLTMTSELLIVVIAPVPVAKKTPSPISSNRQAAAPSVGSVSCAATSRPVVSKVAARTAARAALRRVLNMSCVPLLSLLLVPSCPFVRGSGGLPALASPGLPSQSAAALPAISG